jgi:hypothetical protein
MPRRGCDNAMNVQTRLQNVADLVENNQYAQATKEIVWLWNHMLEEDKSYSGVRGSYLIDWMKRVAELDESARREFTSLRDELIPEVESANPDINVVMDWFTLSDKLLGDNETIGRWIDRLVEFGEEPMVLRVMRGSVHIWLCDQSRWADAGRLLEPGSLLIARNRLRLEESKHSFQLDDETRRALKDMHLVELVRFHASYLAANRDDEAWLVLELILDEFDYDSACIAIRESAQNAGVMSDRHERVMREYNQRGSK